MQVTSSNNIKIYNLSSGKSLPEWISERKRRMLQKKDVDVRRRIELIQDFNMPGVSTGIKLTRDGKYILATGVYKPRIRCYDVDNLSMKFERCFNAEAVQFIMLSDDYTKIALLQCDRTLEFHAQYGSYYQLRIPKFGYDMAYHSESCDLLIVGASSEIYRLNLEQGRFLNSFQSEASAINKIAIHNQYDFIACGTIEGKVEAWDPRQRQKIALLDCSKHCVTENTIVNGFPSITSLNFKEGLTMAVGTHTGQILLYDIRTKNPFNVKDHMYGLPIKNLEFIKSEQLVASMDPKCVKFWNESNGKPYVTIQSQIELNDLCIVPNTGLLFLANEDKKMLTYFIPNIGPAPSWCYFLDSITEELEESKHDTVYDDYKFVTMKELQDLNLEHLKGTNLLRAYMHGYFIDIRLYNKVKAIVQPTTYNDLKKKMIKNKIEKEREKHLVVKQLPIVNREYAKKLLEKKINEKLAVPTPFEDDRFKDLFENPDFKIDENDDEYTRIKSTIQKANKKKVTLVPESEQLLAIEEEEKNKNTTDSEESLEEDYSEESETDDDEPSSNKKEKSIFVAKDSKFITHSENPMDFEENSIPLEERLKNFSIIKEHGSSMGNKVVTFSLKKPKKQSKIEEERKLHLQERAKCRRPAKRK